MEALAKRIRAEIDTMCVGFHYYKDESVLEKSREMLMDIRMFCSALLEVCNAGAAGEEQMELQTYVIGVLKDYMEALEQQDIVLMLDVLDYGLRKLLNIYIEDDEEDKDDESGNF